MFGDCCIPGLMLILGATLERGPGGGGGQHLPLRLVVGVCVNRLLVLPALGLGWIIVAKWAGECRVSNGTLALI